MIKELYASEREIGIKEQRSKGNVDPKSVEKNHWELGQNHREAQKNTINAEYKMLKCEDLYSVYETKNNESLT